MRSMKSTTEAVVAKGMLMCYRISVCEAAGQGIRKFFDGRCPTADALPQSGLCTTRK